MRINPAQQQAQRQIQGDAAAGDRGRIAPVEPAAVGHRRLPAAGRQRRTDDDGLQLGDGRSDPAAGRPGRRGRIERAAFGRVERMRVLLVPARQYAQGVPSECAIQPVAHTTPAAARPRTVGVAARVVHTYTPDALCAYRGAHTLVARTGAARPGIDRRLVVEFAGAEDVFKHAELVFFQVGILRPRARRDGQNKQQHQIKRLFHCVAVCCVI